MLSVVGHASINLCLNLVFLASIVVSLFSNYFNFLNFKIGLHTITHTLKYEDVVGEVYTSFSNFDSFACLQSRDAAIQVVCDNLQNFRVAGWVYTATCVYLIVSISVCLLNLLMLLLLKGNVLTRIKVPHYTNAPVFVVGAASYFLLSNMDNLTKSNQEEFSVSLDNGTITMFFCAVVSIFTLLHYLFVKSYSGLDSRVQMCYTVFSNMTTSQRAPTSPQDLSNLMQEKSKLEAQLQFQQEKLSFKKQKIQALKQATKGEEVVFEPQESILHKKKPKKIRGGKKPEEEDLEKELQELWQKYQSEKKLWEQEKQELLKPSLELSDYERERNNFYETINQLCSVVESLQSAESMQGKEQLSKLSEISGQVKALSEVQPIQEERNTLRDIVNSLTEELETSRKVSSQLKSENSELQKRTEDLSQELKLKKQLLENTKQALYEKEVSSAELQNKVQSQEITLVSLYHQNDELRELVQEKEKTASENLKEKQELEQKYQSLQKRSLPELNEFEILKSEKESLASKLKETKETLQKQKEQTSTFEYQNEELKVNHEELETKFNQLSQTYENLKSKSLDLERKAKQLQDKEEENALLQSSLQDLETALNKQKSQVTQQREKLKDFQTLEEEKDYYQQQLNSTLQVLDRTKKSFAQLRIDYQEVQNQLEKSQTLEFQVNKLQESLEKSNKHIQDLKQKYSELEKTSELEKQELTYNNSQLNKQLENLQIRLKNQEDYTDNEIQSLQNQLEQSSDQLKRLTNEVSYATQEKQKLEAINQSLQRSGESPQRERETKTLHQQINQMSESLKESQNKLSELIEEKEELRNELSVKQQELQQVSEECQNLHSQLYRVSHRASLEEQKLPSESSVSSVQENIIMEGVSPGMPEHHPLLEGVSKLRKEPPMTYSNVWKLFEAMMQDKCKLDRLDMQMGRQPRTMTEYMLDFVYLHYGLKTLALKQLKALIASLEKLYKIGHPYGVLFCRFLGLFHPRPLPHHLSIFLLMVQEHFAALVNKVKEKPTSSFSQNYEILQFGGQASVIDVIELVSKICGNDREAGERILSQMSRDRTDRVELTILKICGTLARMGKTSDYIFDVLEANYGSSVEYSEFSDCIRLMLNIWVSQEEVEELCGFLDDQDTSLVSFEDWNEKIKFTNFAEKAYSKLAMVTKADFLNSLVDEYEYEVVQEYYQLRQMVRPTVLDFETCCSLLGQIDPTLESSYFELVFEEAKEHEQAEINSVSPEAFCIVILKNRIGGYGVGLFDVYALDQSLPKPSTKGPNSELVVERNRQGRLEVEIKKKSK